MKNLYLILKNGMKRSRILIPGVLVMVAILTVCFFGGRAIGANYEVDSIPVGVIDRDHSAVSADMLSFMQEKLKMQIIKTEEGMTDEEAFYELTQGLLDRRVSVIIEIPQRMQEDMLAGKKPEITMTALDEYANEAYTRSYLNSYMQRTMLLTEAAGGDALKLEELLKEAAENGRTVSLLDGTQKNMKKSMDERGLDMMMGFFFFIGFGYPMFMGLLILEDKKNGTFRRIQISSVKPAAYIGGMAIGNLAASALIVAGILTVFSFYGIESNIPFWLIALLMMLFFTFCVGFNLVAAFLTKSGFAFLTVGVAYISIGNIVGGAYFPLGENVLNKISVLVPQYFIMNTVRGIAENASYAYGTNFCILLLMLVLVYLIAAVVYTKREN